MANVIITKSNGFFKIDFGVLSGIPGRDWVYVLPEDIRAIAKDSDRDVISFEVRGDSYFFSFDDQTAINPKSMMVDSVLGSVPTTIIELGEMLSSLKTLASNDFPLSSDIIRTQLSNATPGGLSTAVDAHLSTSTNKFIQTIQYCDATLVPSHYAIICEV